MQNYLISFQLEQNIGEEETVVTDFPEFLHLDLHESYEFEVYLVLNTGKRVLTSLL